MRSKVEEVLAPLIAVAAALLISAVLISVAGYSPVVAFSAMLRGAFGSKVYLAETLLKAVPLLLSGLGVALAFRCRALNIGAEGQIYMGAIVVAWLGVSLKGVPAFLLIPFLLMMAAIAGGLWGAVAGWGKAKLGASEVVTTVMLNEIAILFASFLVQGPLQEPRRFYPETSEIVDAAKLPLIMPGTRLHAGIIIAVFIAILLHVFLFKTISGFHIRTVGANPTAARFLGINVEANTVLAMLLSGALAGIAGGVEIMGVTWKLYQYFSPGYGYDALAVALLAKNNPIWLLGSAVFIGALRSGANMMQRSAGIPSSLAVIVQGLIIVFVLGGEFFYIVKDWYVKRWSQADVRNSC